MTGELTKGLAYASAAKELESLGFRFDTYVGTSSGAIAATLLAFGGPAEASSWMKRPENHPGKMFGRWGLCSLLRFLRTRTHAFSTHRFANSLEGELQVLSAPRGKAVVGPDGVSFQDLPDDRTLIIFSARPRSGAYAHGVPNRGDEKNSVVQAVLESMTIPFVFEPQRFANRLVYDGGLLANLPLDVYRRDVDSSLAETDYLAIYLESHDPDEARAPRRGPFAEQVKSLVEIVVDRDDHHFARKETGSFIFVNTFPIGTADFDVRGDELDLLETEGRLGVLTWAVDRSDLPIERRDRLPQEIRALREQGNRLRAGIIARRRRRRLVRRVLFVALVLALSACWLVGAYGTLKWISSPSGATLPPDSLASLLPDSRKSGYKREIRDLVTGNFAIFNCPSKTSIKQAWLNFPEGIYSVREFVVPKGCVVTPGLSPTDDAKAVEIAVNQDGRWQRGTKEIHQAYESGSSDMRVVAFSLSKPEDGGMDEIVGYGRKLGPLGPEHDYEFGFFELEATRQLFTPLLFGVSATRWDRLSYVSVGTPGYLTSIQDQVSIAKGSSPLLDSEPLRAAAQSVAAKGCSGAETLPNHQRLCTFIGQVESGTLGRLRGITWKSLEKASFDGTVLFYRIAE